MSKSLQAHLTEIFPLPSKMKEISAVIGLQYYEGTAMLENESGRFAA